LPGANDCPETASSGPSSPARRESLAIAPTVSVSWFGSRPCPYSACSIDPRSTASPTHFASAPEANAVADCFKNRIDWMIELFPALFFPKISVSGANLIRCSPANALNSRKISHRSIANAPSSPTGD
jgi:hypothetical protein